MTGKIVLENVKHKPMRSLLTILLIGVPVTLILCLIGVSNGMIEGTEQRTRGIGADVIVRPPGSTLLTLGGGVPEAVVGYFAKQPHVALAMGVVNQPVEGVTLGATGIDLAAFNRMSGGFTYLEGGPFERPDDVLVDEYYAGQKKLRVGETVRILNHAWRISGIIASGKLNRIVFPIQVLQQLTSNTGKVSQIYLKADRPANTPALVAYLKAQPALAEYTILSMDELTSLYNVNNIPALREFIGIIMAIGVIIGLAVVCLSMYMAVLQRTREIGILKSLGASKAFILRLILLEAMILGVSGSVLGIIMSYGAWWLIRTLVPASLTMAIVYSWWPIAAGIALIGTELGALYPGWIAASHDPIEALAYE